MDSNKTISIKNATDAQLDSLIIRLRKEVEAQRMIRELVQNSTPEKLDVFGNKDYSLQPVSTEIPVEKLYHVGIPGMKWGVRKTRSSSSSSSPGKIVKGSGGKIEKSFLGVSKEHVRARELNAKGKKHLSNSELKELATRMDLEAKYNKLNPSKFKKGMQIAAAITAAGTTMATMHGLAKGPLGQDIKRVLTKTTKS